MVRPFLILLFLINSQRLRKTPITENGEWICQRSIRPESTVTTRRTQGNSLLKFFVRKLQFSSSRGEKFINYFFFQRRIKYVLLQQDHQIAKQAVEIERLNRENEQLRGGENKVQSLYLKIDI